MAPHQQGVVKAMCDIWGIQQVYSEHGREKPHPAQCAVGYYKVSDRHHNRNLPFQKCTHKCTHTQELGTSSSCNIGSKAIIFSGFAF